MTLKTRIKSFLDPVGVQTEHFIAGFQAAKAQFDTERHLWTDKGHVLVSGLTNDVQWVVHEGGKGIDFIDRWVDSKGVEVSRAVHIYNQAGAVSSDTASGVVNSPPDTPAVPTPATPGANS